MLQRLCIENYALIRKLDIEISDGFTVITGETGAGKSILLGAMGLILGQRADSTVLFDKSPKCVVEGTFLIKGYDLDHFFQSNSLDYDDMTILRREILQSGKSRAFINDTPVTLNIMKELGERLVNIHSQHSITTLNERSFQLAILDQYAGLGKEIKEYKKVYAAARKLKDELEDLRNLATNRSKEQDYKQFLYDELKNAQLSHGEQEDLEKRLNTLTHAEEIKRNLYTSLNLLDGNEPGILSRLNEIIGLLNQILPIFPDIEDTVIRLKSDLIDLKDIGNSLSSFSESVEVDPNEASRCAARLDQLYHLQKKHQVSSVQGLLEILNSLDKEIVENDHLDEKIKKLEDQLSAMVSQLEFIAGKVSEARNKHKVTLENIIHKSLIELALPNSVFTIALEQAPTIGPEGIDQVRFLFSANKGIPPDEISKVASGGELSRLMLALKSLISQRNLLPTIIFDEIDSGVSGEIAGRMGEILRNMGKSMQVIAITHLPQIAGCGKAHFYVYKADSGKIAETRIEALNEAKRVEEIAKMLSGAVPTEAARKAAKELLIN